MKALIVEDEAAAARRLQKLILEADPGIEIAGQVDSIESFFQWWEEHPRPDILFLDIHLADGSSFEIFNHLTINLPIIFTTAYDQYAVNAFKVNAVDYLLKPIKLPELRTALLKYHNLVASRRFDYRQLVEAMQARTEPRRFLIRLGQSIRLVDMKEVAYFYTHEKITFLVTREGKRYPLDHSLEKLDEMVDTRKFFRINRQFLVNIDAIKDMYAYSKSRVRIELDPPIELETIVSTDRSPHFKKWLTGEVY